MRFKFLLVLVSMLSIFSTITLIPAVVSAASSRATTKTQGDFNLSNRFSFEIDGVLVGGVHTVDGLESESDVVEFQDSAGGLMHTRPGNHKPGKMTVTKDWSNTSEWYKWRKAVLDGKVDRRSISVIFHNDAGEEAGRMNFYNCWPSAYRIKGFDSKNSGHLTETLEFSFDSTEMK